MSTWQKKTHQMKMYQHLYYCGSFDVRSLSLCQTIFPSCVACSSKESLCNCCVCSYSCVAGEPPRFVTRRSLRETTHGISARFETKGEAAFAARNFTRRARASHPSGLAATAALCMCQRNVRGHCGPSGLAPYLARSRKSGES